MKVLLLAGGSSSERLVSLRSGRAMFDALRRLGHGVAAFDPAEAKYLSTPDQGYQLPENLDTFHSHPQSFRKMAELLSGPERPEIVVSALHGGCGEGGQMQAVLELSGIPFTGSGMAASAITMDKALTKQLMRSIGVPTADWVLLEAGRNIDESILAHCDALAYPLIVKPNDGGSTVGLTKVDRRADVPAAVERSRRVAPRTLIEAYLPGRELTATVLNGQPLPLVEIRPKNELYDFEAKYTKGKSEYLCPAPIDEKAAQSIRTAAAALYQAAGCLGVARADFILREDGSFACLEINTLPGMTELSLAPMAAQAAGISFDSLIAALLDNALAAVTDRRYSL